MDAEAVHGEVVDVRARRGKDACDWAAIRMLTAVVTRENAAMSVRLRRRIPRRACVSHFP